MDEKKNIDRLFQEKFKDFEAFPDPVVWKNIEKQIRKKKKRRVIPLWWRIGGAAAILLLVISSGLWFFGTDKSTQEEPNEIIISRTDQNNDEINEKNTSKDVENSVNTEPTLRNKEKNLISETGAKRDPVKAKETERLRNINSDNVIAKLPQSKEESKALQVTSLVKEKQMESKYRMDKLSPESLSNPKNVTVALEEDLDKEGAKIDIQSEIDKMNATETKEIAERRTTEKWSIGPVLAPVYYNTMNNGSPIDPTLDDNNKVGSGSVSYGIKFNYKLSDRFSLQSGINAVELGYSTENVTALLSSSLLDDSSTNINTNVEGVSIAAIATAPSQSTEEVGQRSSFDLSGNLNQSMEYVEIPIEAKYRLSQKRIGINLIGGFSTYVLYKNNVSITTVGKTTTLGEASNINDLNFSGNLGLDFDYNITKKLYINVSPMFKYQFNTFSENSGGFQPYYFGVYTGLNFRF